MKSTFKLKRSLMAGTMAVGIMLAGPAFAGATLHDVETAVRVNKDYQQGESLIREVVANNPDDARDHYIYSQILRHNGKLGGAQHEMAEAKRLDPAFSFDKNPARVREYEASLNAAGGAPPVIRPQPAPQQDVAAQAAPPLPTANERKSGATLLWAILILGLVGAAAYFFFRRVQERDRMEDQERMNTVRQDQMKQASALLESVKALKLDIRIAKPADGGATNTALLAEVDEAEARLVDLIERLGKLPVAQGEVDDHAERLAHLRRVFEGKPDPAPQAQAHEVTQFGDPNAFGQPQAPLQAFGGPMYQQPVIQPVYMQNPGGGMGPVGGLLTGMALGSLMGGGHDRDVIREIVPSRANDGDSGGASDIDFGSDDSGGGVDFGGSDDN